ncbi:MAG: hypothetical protein LC775_06020, partial [Acidobacteria bacterium]|nr:hypothetical protein [Acidobacteriota bacterium]
CELWEMKSLLMVAPGRVEILPLTFMLRRLARKRLRASIEGYTVQAHLSISSTNNRKDHHSCRRIELRNDLCRPSERALGKLIRFVSCDEGDALVVVTKLDGERIQAAEFPRRER